MDSMGLIFDQRPAQLCICTKLHCPAELPREGRSLCNIGVFVSGVRTIGLSKQRVSHIEATPDRYQRFAFPVLTAHPARIEAER